ncbi:hypothetical protein MKX03_011068 [Papaver bracteatum]|nr:hypothetical protein MKX03_011068 [Papaver bracteatum]
MVDCTFFHHRFMVRFEVEDHTGTLLFVSLDSEDNAKSAIISGFSQILQQAVDFQITINSFNMKKKYLPSSPSPVLTPLLC